MWKKILLAFLVMAAILSYGVYWAFFDMSRLPKDELISQATSPDGTFTIKAYRSNGGATTSYAILGELSFNKENKKFTNIYWNNHEDQAILEWMDDDTVVINGHELDVPFEKFDFRRK
jgi:hypothetical protein